MLQPQFIIYILLVLAGAITGLVGWGMDKNLRAISLLLCTTVVSECLCKVLAATIENNCYVYHFYNPLQLTLWGYFFHSKMQGRAQKAIYPMLAVSLLLSILNSIFLQRLSSFPGNFLTIESLMLLFWSLQLFLQQLDRAPKDNIFADPAFIITVAVIWFNLVSFVFFRLFNLFVFLKIPTKVVRDIHHYSNYTYYSLLLLAMCLNLKKKDTHE